MIEHTRLSDYRIENNYVFDSIFKECSSLFNDSNYVVANLETPVAGEELGFSSKNYNFNTPTQILGAIKRSGIDLLTVANNHCLDRGIEGIDLTITNIKKEGLDYVGATRTNEPYFPLIKCISGINVGFMSYTYGTEACYNLNYLKRKDRYRVCLLQNQELSNPLQRYILRSNYFIARVLRKILRLVYPSYFKKNIEDHKQSARYQKRRIIREIKYLKEHSSDMIIMCLHSGGQFNDYPTKFTNNHVKFLFDNGVDLIVCNHEHLIQKSSINGNNDVVFCLGNFTSNYGIDREPFDKEANCSIAFHLMLSKKDNRLVKEYSFSILRSKRNENGSIGTKPLYNDYHNARQPDEKAFLIKLNTRCISRFLGLNIKEDIIPAKEYMYDELIKKYKHD